MVIPEKRKLFRTTEGIAAIVFLTEEAWTGNVLIIARKMGEQTHLTQESESASEGAAPLAGDVQMCRDNCRCDASPSGSKARARVQTRPKIEV